MSENSVKKIGFSSAKGRKVEAAFDGGSVSTDGGLLLMREVDRKLGLIGRVSSELSDGRERGKVRHACETMLRQRVMSRKKYQGLIICRNENSHCDIRPKFCRRAIVFISLILYSSRSIPAS